MSSSSSTRVVEANGLFRDEHFWRDHYTWLEGKGYQLRPRYRPNWTPSWLGTKKDPDRCEDGRSLLFTTVLDARRLSDGKIVAIKRLSKSRHPREVEIAMSFSRSPLVNASENHCVPIIDTFDSPRDADVVLLVMPYLIQHEKIPFVTVGEVAELVRQLLEGLRFIHTHNVAHRDIMTSNIMMETAVYSDVPHPIFRSKNYDFTRNVKLRTRTECPVKYYYTDFGISCRIPEGEQDPREPPILGGDRTVPEHQKLDEPRNPYRTDMYCLGNAIRTQFLQPYSSFNWLAPLVNDMTREEPNNRPTIADTCTRFSDILEATPSRRLRSRVVPRGENVIVGVFRAFRHAIRTAVHIVTHKAALPTPGATAKTAKKSGGKHPSQAPPPNPPPGSPPITQNARYFH
ncbi:kinase-like domain-containing protein [Lenzites betulinus]|nr:kinase-like domain-containing protein [Lenzites betulinus]